MEGHIRGEDGEVERQALPGARRAGADAGIRSVTPEQRRLGWAAVAAGTLMMLAGAVAAVAAGM